MKTTVSGLLSKDHCEKLAVFFDLTPAERDTVLNDVIPGMVLMKILDERELIMPNKMIGLYEGLKASHLNKIARNVLNYIDAPQRKDVMKSDVAEDKQTKVCTVFCGEQLVLDECNTFCTFSDCIWSIQHKD